MTASLYAGSPATEAFRTARNQLMGWRGDHRAAVSGFRWPDVGDRFNWAVDWFDAIARGNERPALMILEEADAAAGQAAQWWSYDTMARRSDQVAAWLAQQGVAKGDAVIVMLSNQVDLWETMLGIIKLGAVIMPTATAAGPAELRDRFERGGATFAVANASDTGTFDGVSGEYGRFAVTRGEAAPDGWASLDDAYRLDVPPAEHPGTTPEDRLLLYFTSGTTSKPKLVEHTQVSYPVGHLSTMYWLGLEPGDVHLNISSPGWAKHAWSCFFAPWNAGATVVVHNYARFRPQATLELLARERIDTLCAHGVAHAHQRRPLRRLGSAARGHRRRRTAQPRGHRAGQQGVGPAAAGRLRPDRDHGPGGQHPGVTGKGRLDGPTAPGLPPRAADRIRRGGRQPVLEPRVGRGAVRRCPELPTRTARPPRSL